MDGSACLEVYPYIKVPADPSYFMTDVCSVRDGGITVAIYVPPLQDSLLPNTIMSSGMVGFVAFANDNQQ